MADLHELKKLIKDAIENGANNLEQIHKFIAKLPMEYLEDIDAVKDIVKDTQEYQDKTIGNIYDLIRKLNDKVEKVATEILGEKKA